MVFAKVLRGRAVLESNTKIDSALIVKFGLFEADLARSTLSRQGTRIKIQEQPFRILAMLLRRNGEIVKRDELCQALWPAGTHVNSDGSLNAALKKLRAALQDDAENPRFIETVPRQGYRFLAPIHVVSNPGMEAGQAIATVQNDNNSSEVRLRLNPELATEAAL